MNQLLNGESFDMIPMQSLDNSNDNTTRHLVTEAHATVDEC